MLPTQEDPRGDEPEVELVDWDADLGVSDLGDPNEEEPDGDR